MEVEFFSVRLRETAMVWVWNWNISILVLISKQKVFLQTEV